MVKTVPPYCKPFFFFFYLSTPDALIVGNIKEIHAQLRDRIPTDPQKDVLTIFQHKQPSTLEFFAAEVHRLGHLNTVGSNSATMLGHVMKGIKPWMKERDQTLRGKCRQQVHGIRSKIRGNLRATTETNLYESKK